MIAAGAYLVLGIVVGILGAGFARPGPTDRFPWAGLGGFLVALFVLYPLLTAATLLKDRGDKAVIYHAAHGIDLNGVVMDAEFVGAQIRASGIPADGSHLG